MNYGTEGATKSFWVVRTDGSETDFSLIWAMKGTPSIRSLPMRVARQ